MKRLIRILFNWRTYKGWKARVRGDAICDYRKDCGYYFSVGYGHDSRGRIETWDMTSGRKGKFKLIDYRLFSDPGDMIKESQWQFLGYENDKELSEMSFEEYLVASEKYGFKN